MPAQPSLLRIPVVPGAVNLSADQLTLGDILRVDNGGPLAAQTTLEALAAFLGIVPFFLATRVVTQDSEAVITATDVALMIKKTIGSATSLSLPTPSLGYVLIFKDMKGDSESNPITLDAGAGKLINGLQTLVMNANYATTILIGASATQWGTLI